MDVAILLTTYNSSSFLDVLIQSIINQSYVEWTLYIRDDDSCDNTVEKIIHYTKLDTRILYLKDDKKRGAKNGFMWLLEQVDSDFYMFCDHDDVWLPDKVRVTLNKMLSCKDVDRVPIIVHTDLYITDLSLNILYDSFFNFYKIDYKKCNDKKWYLFYNDVTGCTMMINKCAKKISLPISKYARMHDSWIAVCVMYNNGRIECINDKTIYYRQHSNNTIGAKRKPLFISHFFKLLKHYKKTCSQYKCAKSLTSMNVIYFAVLKIYYFILSYAK